MIPKDIFNWPYIASGFKGFNTATPFNHCVIDNFLDDEFAEKLSKEIPAFDSTSWHEYNNPLEIKKTCNNWNLFPPLTYSFFSQLNSGGFIDKVSTYSGISPLFPDAGLNGGGWHIHRNGGKLNPHLDYSLHPKLKLQRKLNLIIYLQEDWENDWGGHLGLYGDLDSAKEIQSEIVPLFNRAIFFDTTQNSWHGLSQEVKTPNEICRKSIAVYYLTQPPLNVDERGKALFALTEDQKDDAAIRNLIQKRSGVVTASSVYK